MADLNLGDYDIFARIVASGSMSQAARDLGLAPAMVSKRIKKLEERLGARLFQRTTRQISLTEAGEGFYERVLAILATVEEAESFVSGKAGDVAGRIKLSAPTSFGRMHVAPHLKTFFTRYPKISVHLILSDDYQDIVGEGYDLALRIGKLGDSTLVARRLAPVTRILCAAPSYLAERGIPKTASDLADHACIPAHNRADWHLVGPEGPVTVKPEGPLATNSSEVIREAVLSGLGIALRSTWDIGPALSDGRLVRVLPDYDSATSIGLYALYPSRQYLPAKVRALIDFLAELYGPVPYWDAP